MYVGYLQHNKNVESIHKVQNAPCYFRQYVATMMTIIVLAVCGLFSSAVGS